MQVWGGLLGAYTNNKDKSDQLELRPFAGAKFFLPNSLKWNIYNFTRYEYRALQDRETSDWNNYSRLRVRFGVEFPLAKRKMLFSRVVYMAWQILNPTFGSIKTGSIRCVSEEALAM